MPPERMRLDKWLWAARFFKTRSLATQAVDAGKVRLNGERAKPAREIKAGDRLQIGVGEYEWTLSVVGLSLQRGPAPVAQALYQEDAESLAKRQQHMADRKLQTNPAAEIKGRPTKRDRRQIRRFTEG